MNGLDAYQTRLLDGWEEIFKRGQLTFWVLLGLRDGPKHMADLRAWVGAITDNGVTVEERSLYRALRRFYEAEMVAYETTPGDRGPDRKVYGLTPTGDRVLSAFIERDVRVFSKPEVVRLLDA